MATNYPNQIDDTVTLPIISDNVSRVSSDVINRLRAAIIAIESEMGVVPSGVSGTIRNRLDSNDLIIDNINDTVQNLTAGNTFTAGGDLSGSETSQTVIKINGTTITTAGGSLPIGAVLRTTASGTADWGTVALADADAVSGTLAIENGGTGVTSIGGAFVGTTEAQTLTNKTLTTPIISTISNVGTLTLPASTDTLIGRATTDTLTNKELTSPTLTTPQINDTSSDHQYIFAVSELAADRIITLPLLTGGDTFVFEGHIQTLTNKTLTAPVISSISNSGTITIPTGTDTLVGRDTTDTLTNKTLTSPVLTTPQINDTSSDHQYILAVSELAADRTVTLPLLTGADEFTFNAHAQTLTNKTLTSPTIDGSPIISATTIQSTGNARAKAYSDIASVQTTDATVTSAFTWTITDECTTMVSVEACCTKDDGSAGASYIRRCRIKSDGGVVTVGTVSDIETDEDGLDGDLTIDNSASTGRIRVTGIAATTIDWGVIVTRLEVTHA